MYLPAALLRVKVESTPSILIFLIDALLVKIMFAPPFASNNLSELLPSTTRTSPIGPVNVKVLPRPATFALIVPVPLASTFVATVLSKAKFAFSVSSSVPSSRKLIPFVVCAVFTAKVKVFAASNLIWSINSPALAFTTTPLLIVELPFTEIIPLPFFEVNTLPLIAVSL